MEHTRPLRGAASSIECRLDHRLRDGLRIARNFCAHQLATKLDGNIGEGSSNIEGKAEDGICIPSISVANSA